MTPRFDNSQRTSRGQHQNAKDTRGLVLFGENLGDILVPEPSISICPALAPLVLVLPRQTRFSQLTLRHCPVSQRCSYLQSKEAHIPIDEYGKRDSALALSNV